MRELMKRGFEVQPVIGKSLAETAGNSRQILGSTNCPQSARAGILLASQPVVSCWK
jgi:hypothetical protein